MTTFVLHRTTTDTDAIPVVFSQSLNLTNSRSARRNVVHLIAKQTAGSAGKIKYKFYVKIASAPAGINATWILHSSTALVDPLTLVEVSNLLAYEYKIAVEHDTASTTFETYLSYTG